VHRGIPHGDEPQSPDGGWTEKRMPHSIAKGVVAEVDHSQLQYSHSLLPRLPG
jgi:hypothetical protein